MRFELDTEMISALKKGSTFQIAVDHPNYTIAGFVPDLQVLESLISDLEIR